MPPAPLCADDTFAALALSQVVSSLRFFAGTAFLLTIRFGPFINSETGSKSFTTSYCSGKIAALMTNWSPDPIAMV